MVLGNTRVREHQHTTVEPPAMRCASRPACGRGGLRRPAATLSTDVAIALVGTPLMLATIRRGATWSGIYMRMPNARRAAARRLARTARLAAAHCAVRRGRRAGGAGQRVGQPRGSQLEI